MSLPEPLQFMSQMTVVEYVVPDPSALAVHVAEQLAAGRVLAHKCPQCARAYPIVKQIQATMGDRLRFVFRHFPLTNSHPRAQRAAIIFRSGRWG